jgi:hypothetical protein
VARLAAVGERVQVYVDARDAAVEGACADIVATFDAEVFPMACSLWGPARDVDADGRFTVLLTGALAEMGVDGFMRGADLDPGLRAPFSNRCDMIYLSARLAPGPHLRTILAHEYTHAATCSRRTCGRFASGSIVEEEGWLDEAIAHVVEDLHGFSRSNVDYRVRAFLQEPERYRLVVDDYFAADLFRSHGHRGATYLFLRWCVDRYGRDLLVRLAASRLRGVENIEAATGSAFAELYRDWSISLGLRARTRAAAGETPIASPRMSRLVPDGEPLIWNAAGTCSLYAIMDGGPASATRVEVRGPAEAEIQVTAIPLGVRDQTAESR